jgi:phage terminase small subunit
VKKPKARSNAHPPVRGEQIVGRMSEKNPTVCSTNVGSPPVQTRFSPPNHLRPDTAAWWRAVAGDYALEAHHLRILTLAAEAWDRGVEAREAIAKHGTVYVDRFDQPRARPEVAIERDSRIAFARLVRELTLDIDPPDEPGRPPRLGGTTDKAAPGLDWDAEDRRILGLE